MILLSNLSSCVLFIKKCPLPSCEIRKKHRHLLIFKNSKKEAKKKKKAEADSLKALADTIPDKKEKEELKEGEHEATYVEVDGQVLDEEGNAYEDPKEKKKRLKRERKAAKKKAKADRKRAKLEAKGVFVEEEPTDDLVDEDENKYAGLSEEEYKQRRLEEEQGTDSSGVRTFNEKDVAKELKKQERKERKERRKAERKARRGKKGQADYTRIYRSRITKWWRRDQNPKTGKYFKGKGDSKGNSTKKKWLDLKAIFKKK